MLGLLIVAVAPVVNTFVALIPHIPCQVKFSEDQNYSIFVFVIELLGQSMVFPCSGSNNSLIIFNKQILRIT